MTLTVISPPGEEALSLAAAKAFLRVGHAGEDTLISELVAGARARVEKAAGLALVTRTLRRSWTCWPSGLIRRGVALRPGPASTLVAVRLVNAEGVESDVTARFHLAAGRLCVKRQGWCPPVPKGGRAEADFESGFGGAGDVPEDLIQALKLVLLAAYRRTGDAALPEEAQAILAARREVLL